MLETMKRALYNWIKIMVTVLTDFSNISLEDLLDDNYIRLNHREKGWRQMCMTSSSWPRPVGGGEATPNGESLKLSIPIA